MLVERLMKYAGRPITKRVAAHIKHRVAEEVTRRTSLTPIGQFDPSDVFIVGYPRSGNTWFQNLVSGIVYGVDPNLAPFSLITRLVPDVHYGRYYTRFGTPMFFKSHHSPNQQYRRVVYLLRDGRDVIVSYYHYLNALRSEGVTWTQLAQGDLPFGKWEDHVSTWLSNPFHADMMVITYEALLEDPTKQLRRFCHFAHLEHDEARLQLVVRNASFENMRAKEVRAKETGNGWYDAAWPSDTFFFRRGKKRSYSDEMPVSVLQSFNSSAWPALRTAGYTGQ